MRTTPPFNWQTILPHLHLTFSIFPPSLLKIHPFSDFPKEFSYSPIALLFTNAAQLLWTCYIVFLSNTKTPSFFGGELPFFLFRLDKYEPAAAHYISGTSSKDKKDQYILVSGHSASGLVPRDYWFENGSIILPSIYSIRRTTQNSFFIPQTFQKNRLIVFFHDNLG